MIANSILLALALLVLFWGVGAYGRLVRLRNQFKSAFARLDRQLKFRYELVPGLVEVAKGYMQDRLAALEAVIAALNQAMNTNATAALDPASGGAVREMAAAEQQFSSSLADLFVLASSCADLQANPNMMQFTKELADAESELSFARQTYNDSVMQYNASIGQFPVSIIAALFAFRPAEILPEVEALQRYKMA